MLVVLSDEQKLHLSLLNKININIAKEFCRLAIDFIKNGVNSKKYQTASVKLEIDLDMIRHSVEAVMHIITECSKLYVTETDFQDSIVTLGLEKELNECLLEFYTSNCDDIRQHLKNMSLIVPHYQDLEWRFDVKLSSRMLRYQTTPQIMLKLHTHDGVNKSTKILQTDPVNLKHLTEQLEEALLQVKTSHCRKIARKT